MASTKSKARVVRGSNETTGTEVSKVERPAFSLVELTGEDVDRTAGVLSSVMSDPEALGNVQASWAAAESLGDDELSLMILAARKLEGGNVQAQAVAAAIAAKAGRGAQAAYCEVVGVTKGTASKRVLLGKLILTGSIPEGTPITAVATALSNGTRDVSEAVKAFESNPSASRKRGIASAVSRTLKGRPRQVSGTTSPEAESGGVSTAEVVKSACSLLSPDVLAGMSDSDFATVTRAVGAALKRIQTAAEVREGKAAA